MNNVFSEQKSATSFPADTACVNNIFAFSQGYGVRTAGGRLAGNLYFSNALGDHLYGTRTLTVAEVNALPEHDPAFPSLAADPRFFDDCGDFRLRPGSTGIDAGDTASGPTVVLIGDEKEA